MSYEYDYGTYSAIWNDSEGDRAKELAAVYFEEIHRLYDKYGKSAAGHMSLDKIHSDMDAEAKQTVSSEMGTSVDLTV